MTQRRQGAQRHPEPHPTLSGDIEFNTGRSVLAALPDSAPKGIDVLSSAPPGAIPPHGRRSTTVDLCSVANGTRVSGRKAFPQRNALDVEVTAEAIDS